MPIQEILRGYNSRVTVNQAVLSGHAWELALSVDEHDITCASDPVAEAIDPRAGFRQLLISTYAAEAKILARWDKLENPFTAPLKLYSMEEVVLRIYPDNAQRDKIITIQGYVTSFSSRAAVRETVDLEFVVKSHGRFSLPHYTLSLTP